MAHAVWSSRPADLYGRRKRDRLYTALWGVGTLFGGLASASRWNPSRVVPVQRTNAAVVTKRELLTPDVVALTLADAQGGLLPSWTPGAHIDIRLASGRRRQYSLCGPPGRRTDYRIAVRRIADGGGGSIEMHDTFDVGDTVEFEGPRNAFYLVTDEREMLFVIGGIGVTPILPMIRLAQQRGIDWRAVYAGRSREYMPLLDELLAVAPERVTVWADDERGRIAAAEELLAHAGPTTAVYVCGPTAMLEVGARGARPTRQRATALRTLRPAARRRRCPVRAGTRPFAARTQRAGEPVGAGRHARRRPDDRLLVPARLLWHLQGESACGAGRSPRPHRGGRRRNAGLRLPGER